MDEAILQRLDERTDNLIKVLDNHIAEDREKFDIVFKELRENEKFKIRMGIFMVAAVTLSQLVIGAWVKGLFG